MDSLFRMRKKGTSIVNDYFSLICIYLIKNLYNVLHLCEISNIFSINIYYEKRPRSARGRKKSATKYLSAKNC